MSKDTTVIELILECEPETMAAILQISKEDGKSVPAVLHDAMLKGLAYRTVCGPQGKKLVVRQKFKEQELPEIPPLPSFLSKE